MCEACAAISHVDEIPLHLPDNYDRIIQAMTPQDAAEILAALCRRKDQEFADAMRRLLG